MGPEGPRTTCAQPCAHGARENLQPEQSQTSHSSQSDLLHSTQKTSIATATPSTQETITSGTSQNCFKCNGNASIHLMRCFENDKLIVLLMVFIDSSSIASFLYFHFRFILPLFILPMYVCMCLLVYCVRL